jgi:hypothetical protein
VTAGCTVKNGEKVLAFTCISWGIILTPPNRARELSESAMVDQPTRVERGSQSMELSAPEEAGRC